MANEPNIKRKGNAVIHHSPDMPIMVDRKAFMDPALSLLDKLIFVYICSFTGGAKTEDIESISGIPEEIVIHSAKTIAHLGYLNAEG